jgi:NTE family protein
MTRRPKIGLALGGGGARGLGHIGVLKVLQREGIHPNLIVGTSMGALVGGAYAIKPDAIALERLTLDYLNPEGRQNRQLRVLGRLHWQEPEKSDRLHRLLRIAEKELALSLFLVRKSMLSERDVRRMLKAVLPDIQLEETRIPFAVTTVDLISGREVILNRGPLIQAVMASCAVPGVMPPVPWNGKLLADGGVIDPLPCRPAKEGGSDFVIGVDVGSCVCRPQPLMDGVDEIHRAMEIICFHLNKQSKEYADVVIEPDVKGVDWTDFLKYKDLIRNGEEAAESEIEKIRGMVTFGFGRRLFRRARGVVLGLSKKVPEQKILQSG